MGKKRLRIAVLALGLTFAVSLGGCYGSFTVTKKLHSWNGSVSGNKFVQTLIFWGLVIIPAYELVALGDGIIFNVIEFWTGSNPIADGTSLERPRATAMADGSVVFERNGHRFRMEERGEGRLALSLDGHQVVEAQILETGGLIIADQEKQRTVYLSPTELSTLEQRLLADRN